MRLVASPLTRGDIAAVSAIEVLSHPSPWSAGMFESELTNGIARFWVYREDSGAAGSAGMTGGGPDTSALVGYAGFWNMVGNGNITNVTVAPDRRRQGWGSLILAHLLDEMRNMSMEFATLEVRESNLAAIGLYERAGFTRLGARRAYYRDGETALILGRRLDGGSAGDLPGKG